jgi:UDP:flavonoid glycosyltransferase YjiC (YdhE family)
MKIILAALAQVGHLNPVLAAGRILQDAGHEVKVLTGKKMKSNVESAGLRFVALPAEADLDLSDINATFPERKNIPPGPEQLRFDFERVFVDPIAGQYKGLKAVLEDFPADVIMHDMMFGGSLPMLLAREPIKRPVIAALGVTFLPVQRDDGAPMGLGLPPASGAEQIAAYADIARQVDAGFGTPIRARADALLQTLGARPLPASFSDSLVTLPDVYFQPAVPGFEYPSRAAPGTLRYIGSLPLPARGEVRPELAAALAAKKRIVLVTQGTVANHDLGQLVGPTIEAMAPLDDVFVFATTGGRPVDAVPLAKTSNAFVSEFLKFADLLPYVDVLVTNGGYGTVTHALKAGVPVIVAGSTEDKPEVAARVAWSGAGINLQTDAPSATVVRAAIEDMLSNAAYRTNAQRLAAEFDGLDAASLILQSLDELVEKRRHL